MKLFLLFNYLHIHNLPNVIHSMILSALDAGVAILKCHIYHPIMSFQARLEVPLHPDAGVAIPYTYMTNILGFDPTS